MKQSQKITQKLTGAFHFAAQKHVDQRRKGVNAEPYINHPVEVADILARHGADATTIMAGVLHDTIEDTKTTYKELKKIFGKAVANVVRECTDNKQLPKQERKRLQIVNAPHKSKRAKMVKLADKITNLNSIADAPPPDWSLQRRQEYFVWAKFVADGLRGANKGLEEEFDRTWARGAKVLGMTKG